nr:MAG TPA: hypothetical protein [Caudoviricetes sp.]
MRIAVVFYSHGNKYINTLMYAIRTLKNWRL